MSSLDEKRVYSEKTGSDRAFLATGAGVVRVRVSGDLVGEFGLVERCVARDVTASEGRLAVATDEDVLVSAGEAFEGTDFGPADAVGFADGTLVAAGEGRVAVRRREGWESVGDLADVRAVDGHLLATADGVFRLADGGLTNVGLADAHDVTARGVPLAATGEGLYALGNGWMDLLDGDFRVVATDGDRAHAATPGSLSVRESEGGEWTAVDLPATDPVAGVAYGATTYAVTGTGTFLVEDREDGEWRTRALGVPDVRGIAVV
ncbi:HVO_0234 family beta-propeller protein [Halomarina litorea]|uniref:HVO_0234 family beta-propeller protein n=1 Tax=Halomarina litorea TaxID=2961595 RepID=UPI0020C4F6FC|nr:hypothetical protein [Halomarina sp. BCD28]